MSGAIQLKLLATNNHQADETNMMGTWSFSWALRNFLSELLMPPGVWVILILITVFVFRHRQALQRKIIVMSALMIWATSTNYFAIQLASWVNQRLVWPRPLVLESLSHQEHDSKPRPQAIVVLGGGRRQGALEVPQRNTHQDLGAASMERLRFGASLARATQLPILVTGGAPDKTSAMNISEAELMNRVLKVELNVQAKWIEGDSNTTQENAQLSAGMLKQEGIQVIYLVTHFWHMPRAKAIFEREGLKVLEAPMGFYQKETFTPLDFYPSGEGFQRTRWILHEILGSIWYELKF